MPELGGIVLAERGYGYELPPDGRGGRTLAHEFGHSLGLDHMACDSTRNIMANACWQPGTESALTPGQITASRARALVGHPTQTDPTRRPPSNRSMMPTQRMLMADRTDHTRVFEAVDLAHTGHLFAGTFLFGQGGIARVPCQRTAGFLPAGVVRSVPVEHEPADIWWPCVMVRGKPVSVYVSIDGGPAQEFSWISSRELGEFAIIAVTRGRAVRAYTKQYIAEKAQAHHQ
jgi:hypothetical protein